LILIAIILEKLNVFRDFVCLYMKLSVHSVKKILIAGVMTMYVMLTSKNVMTEVAKKAVRIGNTAI